MEIRPGSELTDDQKHRDFTVVTGQPKFGKSFLTKHVLLKKYPRVIILDRMGEYDAMEINELETLVDYIGHHKVYRIRVTDLTMEKVDQILQIAWFFGDMCIVFEEANIWFPSRGSLTEIQSDIILRSRHRAISLIYVTQRYRRLHLDLRAAYQDMYIFRQKNQKDIDELENDTGEDLSAVSDYPVGKYFHAEG
jgi:hypothetical protein